MRLERITARDRLVTLEPQWWALWRACAAMPFASPAWLLAWWDAFAPGALLALAVWQDERLVALAPFYTDEAAVARPLGISLSDYLDVLVDPGHREAIALLSTEMTHLLATTVSRWELHDLAPKAAALDLMPDAQAQTRKGATCPVLTRAELCGTLSGAIPARKRRKLRMAHHRAERAGGNAIVTPDSDATAPAFEALVQLHGQRWSQEGGGVLRDARTLAFHRAALPRLRRAGVLDLRVCMAGDAIAGVYYGLRDSTRAYAYLGGYDPQHAALSPGSRLLDHAIAGACARGARAFHFLRGGEAYKYDWGAFDVFNIQRTFHAHGTQALD